MMREITQRLTIQGISISRIDTKDAQDLPEVIYDIIPVAKKVIK